MSRFGLAMADLLIVNINHHTIGLKTGDGLLLLKNIFEANLRLLG